MIHGIDHIALEVNDFDNRIRMLTERFTMRLLRTGTRHSTGQRIAMLADPRGFKLELIEGDNDAPTFQHLAFDVDDVTEHVDDAVNNGLALQQPTHRLGAARATTALVADDHEFAVQLIDYDPDSPDRTLPPPAD